MEGPDWFVGEVGRFEGGHRVAGGDRDYRGDAVGKLTGEIPHAASAHRDAGDVNAVAVDAAIGDGAVDHGHDIGEDLGIIKIGLRLRRVEECAARLCGGEQVVDVAVDLVEIVGAGFAGAM